MPMPMPMMGGYEGWAGRKRKGRKRKGRKGDGEGRVGRVGRVGELDKEEGNEVARWIVGRIRVVGALVHWRSGGRGGRARSRDVEGGYRYLDGGQGRHDSR